MLAVKHRQIIISNDSLALLVYFRDKGMYDIYPSSDSNNSNDNNDNNNNPRRIYTYIYFTVR